MRNSNKNVIFSGIGLPALLTIVFVVLKLCKVITWRWIWVLAPLWIDAIFMILLLIIFIILASKYDW